MSRQGGLEELDLLLVDGDNLLHAVRGVRDESGVAWLLPRLIRWRPDHLRIVVGLDGHQAPGETIRTRAAPGIELRHSGARSADDLLIELLASQPYAGRSRTAVVTSDRELQARVRRAAGSTRSVEWLVAQLAGRTLPTGQTGPPVGIGQGRPPRPNPALAAIDGERRSWKPGRGATRKRGNPRRGSKGARRR